MSEEEKFEAFEKEYVQNYNQEPLLSENCQDIFSLIFKTQKENKNV